MAFVETPRFPDNLAYGSQSIAGYLTGVSVLQSGYEQRNELWSQARNRFDASYAIRSRADLEEIRNYFHAMRGRFNGFRFKDWSDFSSGSSITGDQGALLTAPDDEDQSIGTGDAAETQFQLVKNYIVGTETLVREIRKPVSGSVVVAVNGSPITEGPGAGEFQVDTTTGIITFGTAPAAAAAITAGYQFDIPCRFDVDEIATVFDGFDVQSASIPIVEIRV
jgi:uncharacterized protein (TIGR02217 family)